MKRSHERLAKLAVRSALVLGVTGLIPARPASAQGGASPCDTARDPSVCGEVSPLIPMQSTEAVHMGLVWKKNSATPKILFHSRFSEYTPNDMADPEIIDLAIARGAFTTPGLQFNSSLRDVLHGFDPFLGLGTNRSADDSFQRLTYGGYLMRQGLSQAVPTRIRANRTMERQLLFDISHPDAFKNSGKFHTALLDEADFALNRAAFAENGYSKGVFYNMYCNARVTLSDGRVYVFGGHDMQSDNGLYKVNIFDPETETWVKRSEPCTRANWHRDPFGRELFARDPNAPFYDNCDPRDEQSTQPSDPSDQKYARWYPAAIALPNNTVLVVGGFDQDNSVGPDPDRVAKGRRNVPQTDTAFTASRVNQVVPEVYDPRTDRNITLENARMAFPLYPQLEVVETGPGRDDWKVCTFDGEIDYGDEFIPGGAKFGVGRGNPRFTKGTTWCLDVLGALKDPNRDIPAKNHWTLLDTAAEVRPYCCPTASPCFPLGVRHERPAGLRAGAGTGTRLGAPPQQTRRRTYEKVVLVTLPSVAGAWGRHGHGAVVVASGGAVVVPRSSVVVVRPFPRTVFVVPPRAVVVAAPVPFVAVQPLSHCGPWWWDGWRWVWIRVGC